MNCVPFGIFSVSVPRLTGWILFEPPDGRDIFYNNLLSDGTCTKGGK